MIERIETQAQRTRRLKTEWDRAHAPELYARKRAKRAANPEKWLATHRGWRTTAKAVRPWVKMLDAAQGRAKAKGVPFDLTAEWAQGRWTGFCELTGIAFDMTLPGRSGPRTFAASIDRIDPKAGYTQANCRFVIFAVNAMKVQGTDADMYRIAVALLTNASRHQRVA